MKREQHFLDGLWQFYFDEASTGFPPTSATVWGDIQVPGPWAQINGLELRHGTGWYRLQVDIPVHWQGKAVILHFGAVNYNAWVLVNGTPLGEHEGGYLPFELDLSSVVRYGDTNELLVRVELPAWGDPETPFAEIPHGKQSWYGPLGGIWQSVWLECRPVLHLTHVNVTPRGEVVYVRATANRPRPEDVPLTFEIVNPTGEVISNGTSSTLETVIRVPAPLLWSPETPHLYTLRASLGDDSLSITFGFRTIETRDGRILLNGQPLYLRGALDQDYYPDLIYTPPSLAFLEDQLRKAKAMGLNCLRAHIKVVDPRYLEVADRLGMLIWAELPNWSHLTDAAVARGRTTLEGMLARDGHHPSIIIWTIINEAWGTELDTNPDHRARLAELYAWLKTLDPTRLVVDNSACFDNFHVAGDLDDFHFYAAMPDGAARWDQWVNDFATRPKWLYAPDATPTGTHPLLVSEFGNWGLPDIERLLSHYGENGALVEPWWFETGWDWRPGDVYPHGVQSRFWELYLDRVFGDLSGLAQASQWGQYEALKYEIETMRLRPELSGYVITEFTDVHWECNGLLDLLRNPKVYFDRMADLQGDMLIIPRAERVSLWAGETCAVNVSLSNVGVRPFNGSLSWALHAPGLEENGGQVMNLNVLPFQTLALAPLTFPVSDLTQPVRATLQFILRDAQGAVRTHSDLSLLLFPRPTLSHSAVVCPDPALAQTLADCGYEVQQTPESSLPVILTTLDAAALRTIQQGGRALLLAETPDAVQTPVPRFYLRARKGTSWAGDWASAFAWFRRDQFGAHIPGDGRLDFAFENVFPETVIASVRPKDFEHEVFAGIFVGWLRNPAALVQRIPIGRGHLVVSTFKLREQVGRDPLAEVLLAEMLKLLGGF